MHPGEDKSLQSSLELCWGGQAEHLLEAHPTLTWLKSAELFSFGKLHIPKQLRWGDANYLGDFTAICGAGQPPKTLSPTQGSPGQLMSPLKWLNIPFKGHRAEAGPWGTPAMSTTGIYLYQERGAVIMILPRGIPARQWGFRPF